MVKEIKRIGYHDSYTPTPKCDNTKWKCNLCNGVNLTFLARVDINTNKVETDFDLDDVKCDKCGVLENDEWIENVDNICEHNNTITNECSDCNENELSDYYQDQSIDDGKTDRLVGAILSHILPEIRNLVINYGLRDRIYEIVGEWSKVDFDKLSNSDIDDSIMEQIFKNLSMCGFADFINTYKEEEE